MKIISPTVGELIGLLSQFDKSDKVVIEDADTGWLIEQIHFNKRANSIVLKGEYSEMVSG